MISWWRAINSGARLATISGSISSRKARYRSPDVFCSHHSSFFIALTALTNNGVARPADISTDNEQPVLFEPADVAADVALLAFRLLFDQLEGDL